MCSRRKLFAGKDLILSLVTFHSVPFFRSGMNVRTRRGHPAAGSADDGTRFRARPMITMGKSCFLDVLAPLSDLSRVRTGHLLIAVNHDLVLA